MAYKQISPQVVVEGGTGAQALTDHGILVGSGTSAVTALAVGTDGQLAIGATGADPAFATVTSSDSLLTLTGGANTLDIVAQNAVSSSAVLTDYLVVCGNGGSRDVQSIAAIGSAGQVLTSNGAGALPTFQDSSTGDVSGPVSSTDNALARWDGTSGDTLQDSTVIVSDNGEMTNASQPAFLAYLASADTNVTGNSTIFFLGDTDLGTTLTEVFDQNADFTPGASGGASFVAPVTGRYCLKMTVQTGAIGSSTGAVPRITTSNRDYYQYIGCSLMSNSGNQVQYNVIAIADMDATDTAKFGVSVTGIGADTADVLGAATQTYTNVAGYLIC